MAGIFDAPLRGLYPSGKAKVFNGKRYMFHSAVKSKRDANAAAARLRNSGSAARVVQSARHGYLVYKRG